MSGRALRLAALLALNLAVPFVAVGFGTEALHICSDLSVRDERWAAFLIGAVAFVPVWYVMRRLVPGTVGYLTTLEHELTHILVGLLFLKRPLSLRVTARRGGAVVLTGSNLWITLAPYFLPTVTLPLIGFELLVSGSGERALLTASGASVAYHLLSTWSEIGVVQQDFRDAGLWQSLWLLPVANVVTYGAVLAFVGGELAGVKGFWEAGSHRTLAALLDVAKVFGLMM